MSDPNCVFFGDKWCILTKGEFPYVEQLGTMCGALVMQAFAIRTQRPTCEECLRRTRGY